MTQTLTYYKWLTPEMASHRDRRFIWGVGQVHTLQVCDAPGVGAQGRGLHLMKRPEDALRFGHWPGRLFEAEPAGPVLAEDQYKVRCSDVRLLREVDASLVFGPRGNRVVTFLSWLKDVPWLEAEAPLEAALEAAAEYQARLNLWEWAGVPVDSARFTRWIDAATFAQKSASPMVEAGAWTAWATASNDWRMWAAPWAASAAWGTAWAGLEAGAGAAAWSVAKETWDGAAPWPAPNYEPWQDTANAMRQATRIIAGAAANDAARAVEYMIGTDSLPPSPFEPLMLIWMLGYWPVGVADGRFIIADLSEAIGGEKFEHKRRPNPELLFEQYGIWTT